MDPPPPYQEPPLVSAYPVADSDAPPAYDEPPAYDVPDDAVLSQISGDAREKKKREERLSRIESELRQVIFDIRSIKKTVSEISGKSRRDPAKKARTKKARTKKGKAKTRKRKK
jgi:hypothetical protein